jgi:hypothetical protein
MRELIKSLGRHNCFEMKTGLILQFQDSDDSSVFILVLTYGWAICSLRYEMRVVLPRCDAADIDVPPDGPSRAKDSF